MTMLKVTDLKKSFFTEEIETVALAGVSFEVKEGEFVAIMGPSGCGKSTLLNILGLLDNPTSGEYMLLDKEVGNLRERDRTYFRRGNIGFVFQSFNLIDEMNVSENIELPLIYMGVKPAERKERVKKMLERMDMTHRAKHFPQQLSGGQQQRVAIARALVSNPKLILADEPTGNLDTHTATSIVELLKELARDCLILIVSHNVNDANAYAEGRNVAEVDGGGVENVFDYVKGVAEAVRTEEYPRKRYEREGHKHREGLGDNRLVLGVKKPRNLFLYRLDKP